MFCGVRCSEVGMKRGPEVAGSMEDCRRTNSASMSTDTDRVTENAEALLAVDDDDLKDADSVSEIVSPLILPMGTWPWGTTSPPGEEGLQRTHTHTHTHTCVWRGEP